MISRFGLFSKQHSLRAGCWFQLSTSSVLSDQKAWDAPISRMSLDLRAYLSGIRGSDPEKDIGATREPIEQKEMIRDIEQSLERKHLTRIRQGSAESIETSAIRIDLLRSLKMLSIAFAMIAYPLLEEHGELLESRLASD